ncbi:hypothetical protein LTR39_000900 [Cryomyces antarcticus]|nr:hypothetical protein LTR39_000900 [Cryomyces antarcticus]
MTTVYLPGGGLWRSKRKLFRSPSSTASLDQSPSTSHSCDEPDLEGEDATEMPDLKELNASLQVLTDIFPDVQPEVFREMLSNFAEESRLQVVTENILKSKAKWVRGRFRVPQRDESGPGHIYKTTAAVDGNGQFLPLEERYRSDQYRTAVKQALFQEFGTLSYSAIRAVMAEVNHSYTRARPILLGLVSKSWRQSFKNLLMRRKAPSAAEHPLVTWQRCAKSDRLVPKLKPTKSIELDRELYNMLIRPLLARQNQEQLRQDRSLAEQLNDAEAEELGAIYDCECCFTSTTFEQMSACDEGGHYICFRCIRNAVNESLYGQGWAKNINPEQTSVKCIAPAMGEEGECHGCISPQFVENALLEERDSEDAWRKLQERCAGESLIKSQVKLVRCPFCVYAEADESHQLSLQKMLKEKYQVCLLLWAMAALLSTVAIVIVILPVPSIILFTFMLYYLRHYCALFSAALHSSRGRIARKRRGLKFTCLNPSCARSSCISCSKEWRDIHICYESERLALRSAVEGAMAEAVKRTCPKCNLSFVKSSGCNKLTCICGYQMCYVCRQEIGKESYQHFCQHFRPGGERSCAECEKCDLYRTEDEDVVIKRAAEKAEKEWKDGEAKERGWTREGSQTISRSRDGLPGMKATGTNDWRHPDWELVMDSVLEMLIA